MLFDRCYICDYSESTGSAIMNVKPGQSGKVKNRPGYEKPICDACALAVDTAVYEFSLGEEENEEDQDSPTLPEPTV